MFLRTVFLKFLFLFIFVMDFKGFLWFYSISYVKVAGVKISFAGLV